jgi:hypothetical protein
MRKLVLYLSAGFLALSAVELLGPADGPGASVNARSVVPTGAALQHVDRTHKADRLKMHVTIIEKRDTSKVRAKIIDGCDPAFSPLSRSAASHNFSGRCAT